MCGGWWWVVVAVGLGLAWGPVGDGVCFPYRLRGSPLSGAAGDSAPSADGDWDLCETACEAAGNCSAFALVPPGQTCKLRDDAALERAANGTGGQVLTGLLRTDTCPVTQTCFESVFATTGGGVALSTFFVPLADCFRMCAEDGSCVSFTWRGISGPCSLRGSKDSMEANADTDFFVKEPCPDRCFPLELRGFSTGTDPHSVTDFGVKTFKECEAACAADASCATFIRNPGGMCYLVSGHSKNVAATPDRRQGIQAPCSQDPVCFDVRRNTGMTNVSSDISWNTNSNTIRECLLECVGNANCVAASYDTLNTECRTLSAIAGTENSTNWSAFFVVPCEPTTTSLAPTTTQPPAQLCFTIRLLDGFLDDSVVTTQTAVVHAAACRALCEDSAGCLSADFRNSNSICFTHHALNGRGVGSSGVTGFVRGPCGVKDTCFTLHARKDTDGGSVLDSVDGLTIEECLRLCAGYGSATGCTFRASGVQSACAIRGGSPSFPIVDSSYSSYERTNCPVCVSISIVGGELGSTGDLINATSASEAECRQMCEAEEGCAEAKYNRETAVCRLRSNVLNRADASLQLISWLPGPCGEAETCFRLLDDQGSFGEQLMAIHGLTIVECIRHCASRSDCTALTFWNLAPSTCRLRSTFDGTHNGSDLQSTFQRLPCSPTTTTTLAASTTSRPPACLSIRVFDGKLAGLSLNTVSGVDEAQCRSECESTVGCVAANLNSDTGWCTLREDFDGRADGGSHLQAAVRGPCRGEDACFRLHDDQSADGELIQPRIEDVPIDGCLQECASRPDCAAATYFAGSPSLCRLRSTFRGPANGGTAYSTFERVPCSPTTSTSLAPSTVASGPVCYQTKVLHGRLQSTLGTEKTALSDEECADQCRLTQGCQGFINPMYGKCHVVSRAVNGNLIAKVNLTTAEACIQSCAELTNCFAAHWSGVLGECSTFSDVSQIPSQNQSHAVEMMACPPPPATTTPGPQCFPLTVLGGHLLSQGAPADQGATATEDACSALCQAPGCLGVHVDASGACHTVPDFDGGSEAVSMAASEDAKTILAGPCATELTCYEVHINRRTAGGGYLDAFPRTVPECLQICADDSRCRGFTYERPSQKCILKDGEVTVPSADLNKDGYIVIPCSSTSTSGTETLTQESTLLSTNQPTSSPPTTSAALKATSSSEPKCLTVRLVNAWMTQGEENRLQTLSGVTLNDCVGACKDDCSNAVLNEDGWCSLAKAEKHLYVEGVDNGTTQIAQGRCDVPITCFRVLAGTDVGAGSSNYYRSLPVISSPRFCLEECAADVNCSLFVTNSDTDMCYFRTEDKRTVGNGTGAQFDTYLKEPCPQEPTTTSLATTSPPEKCLTVRLLNAWMTQGSENQLGILSGLTLAECLAACTGECSNFVLRSTGTCVLAKAEGATLITQVDTGFTQVAQGRCHVPMSCFVVVPSTNVGEGPGWYRSLSTLPSPRLCLEECAADAECALFVVVQHSDMCYFRNASMRSAGNGTNQPGWDSYLKEPCPQEPTTTTPLPSTTPDKNCPSLRLMNGRWDGTTVQVLGEGLSRGDCFAACSPGACEDVTLSLDGACRGRSGGLNRTFVRESEGQWESAFLEPCGAEPVCFRALPGVDMGQGVWLVKHENLTPGECLRKCADHPECRVIVINRDHKRCNLKNGTGAVNEDRPSLDSFLIVPCDETTTTLQTTELSTTELLSTTAVPTCMSVRLVNVHLKVPGGSWTNGTAGQTPESCRRLCERDASCTQSLLRTTEPVAGECLLSSGLPTEFQPLAVGEAEGALRGPCGVEDTCYRLHVGEDWNSGNSTRTVQLQTADCLRACAEDPDCDLVVRNTAGLGCVIKRHGGVVTAPHASLNSYVKVPCVASTTTTLTIGTTTATTTEKTTTSLTVSTPPPSCLSLRLLNGQLRPSLESERERWSLVATGSSSAACRELCRLNATCVQAAFNTGGARAGQCYLIDLPSQELHPYTLNVTEATFRGRCGEERCFQVHPNQNWHAGVGTGKGAMSPEECIRACADDENCDLVVHKAVSEECVFKTLGGTVTSVPDLNSYVEVPCPVMTSTTLAPTTAVTTSTMVATTTPPVATSSAAPDLSTSTTVGRSSTTIRTTTEEQASTTAASIESSTVEQESTTPPVIESTSAADTTAAMVRSTTKDGQTTTERPATTMDDATTTREISATSPEGWESSSAAHLPQTTSRIKTTTEVTTITTTQVLRSTDAGMITRSSEIETSTTSVDEEASDRSPTLTSQPSTSQSSTDAGMITQNSEIESSTTSVAEDASDRGTTSISQPSTSQRSTDAGMTSTDDLGMRSSTAPQSTAQPGPASNYQSSTATNTATNKDELAAATTTMVKIDALDRKTTHSNALPSATSPESPSPFAPASAGTTPALAGTTPTFTEAHHVAAQSSTPDSGDVDAEQDATIGISEGPSSSISRKNVTPADSKDQKTSVSSSIDHSLPAATSSESPNPAAAASTNPTQGITNARVLASLAWTPVTGADNSEPDASAAPADASLSQSSRGAPTLPDDEGLTTSLPSNNHPPQPHLTSTAPGETTAAPTAEERAEIEQKEKEAKEEKEQKEKKEQDTLDEVVAVIDAAISEALSESLSIPMDVGGGGGDGAGSASANDSATPRESNFQEDSAAVLATIRDALPFVVANLSDSELAAVGVTVEELVARCEYNRKPCALDRLRLSVDRTYGNCFTWEENHTVQTSGEHGLYMQMRVVQSEFLSSTESVGAMAVVHPRGAAVLPYAEAFSMSVGFYNDFSVGFGRLSHLGAPFPNCVESLNGTAFPLDGSYTKTACEEVCTQEALFDKCRCMDPNKPRLPHRKPRQCGLGEKACRDAFLKSAEAHENRFCDICAVPCRQTHYPLLLTQQRWPHDMEVPAACLQNATKFGKQSGEYRRCLNDKRRETVTVRFHIPSTHSISYAEVAQVSLVEVLAKLGGTLGVCLGASVLTMVEAIALAAQLLNAICKRLHW